MPEGVLRARVHLRVKSTPRCILIFGRSWPKSWVLHEKFPYNGNERREFFKRTSLFTERVNYGRDHRSNLFRSLHPIGLTVARIMYTRALVLSEELLWRQKCLTRKLERTVCTLKPTRDCIQHAVFFTESGLYPTTNTETNRHWYPSMNKPRKTLGLLSILKYRATENQRE